MSDPKLKNKPKASSVVMQVTPHWAMFLVPALVLISSLIFLFKEKQGIYLIFSILCAGFIALQYFLMFSNKKLVLTPVKLYYIDRKVKKITVNLSQCELIDYSVERTSLGKILGYCKIDICIFRNNQKHYRTFNFISSGDVFIEKAFILSENFIEKNNPEYQRRLKRRDINAVQENELDRVT